MHLTDIEAGVLALAAEADAGSWTTFSVLSAAASARRLAERGFGEMRDEGDARSVALRATRRGREALAGSATGLDGVDARILALAAEEPEDGWTRLRDDGADTLAALGRLAELGLGELRGGARKGRRRSVRTGAGGPRRPRAGRAKVRRSASA